MRFKLLIILLFSSFTVLACSAKTKNKAYDPSRMMEKRGSEFYLDGKPFYEISFNKYDLFWQLLPAKMGNTKCEFDITRSYENADRALRELSQLGFKTFRVFGAEHSIKTYLDPAKRDIYYQTIDEMLDMCDKYDLRVVYCLGAATFISPDETEYDLIANPQSRSRALLNDYLRTIVKRYKNRSTIAMWEIQNELLLTGDIGGREGVWNGNRVPTITQVATFHDYVASIIRSIDKLHLITTGDAIRPTLWHQNQYCEHKNDSVEQWGLDSWDQNRAIVSEVQSKVDIYGFHAYYSGVGGFGQVCDNITGEPRNMTLSEWKYEATAQNSPFYLGEWGALPANPKKNPEVFQKNPAWFATYVEDGDKALAIKTIRLIMDMVVDADINLTHFWAYSSDRAQDARNPHRHDITLTRNPELVDVIVEANRQLQLKHMGFTYMKKN